MSMIKKEMICKIQLKKLFSKKEEEKLSRNIKNESNRKKRKICKLYLKMYNLREETVNYRESKSEGIKLA